MGFLADGRWYDEWYDTEATGGRFIRSESQFRHWITRDGGPGPSGEAGFPAEADRYHLYVSLACPWAHRTLIFRVLKGLESMIGVSVVNPLMHEHGWTFLPGDGVVPDPVANARYLYELYLHAEPSYEGRVTVPVLWDLRQGRIVNNESAEIIRMFNTAFDDLGARSGDYRPDGLRDDIDAVNDLVYEHVNNGVYRAGFATVQEAYEEAVRELFEAIDALEARLARQRYLCGPRITEADWRLFTTLVRFDAVYHGHFKCNLRRIEDYPNLSGYLRELYQWPGIAQTVDMQHIKTHYYGSHRMINPTGIVPLGPLLDLARPHGRDHLRAEPAMP